MPHFLENISLIVIGILGLFVIALMLFSYRSNIFVNIYLVFILILCSIRNLFIGLSEITETSHAILDSKLIAPIYLIVIPSLYLYFKSLVKDYKRIYKKDLIHLLYPILNLGLNIFQEYFPELRNQSVENARFISLVVVLLFYLALSFHVLYKNLWRKNIGKSVEKRHYLLIKKWTLFIFIISAFLFLRILFSVYSEKISEEVFKAQSHSFLVIIPWLLVYGKILVNPEILYGYPKLERRIIKIQNQVILNDHIWIFDSINITNAQDKKLSSNIKRRVLPYISDIENYVKNEHPFRNPKFSFPDFSKAVNIPTSHVYYIFKYHAIVSFVEYKNYCRIKDALELIAQGHLDKLTLEGLATKVGFSSYNSFFTAFKKQTGFAPKDYLMSQQNNPDANNFDLSLSLIKNL
jgi:AraC-like DNA-binding protein